MLMPSGWVPKWISKSWLSSGGAGSVLGLERDSHKLTIYGEPVGQADQRQWLVNRASFTEANG